MRAAFIFTGILLPIACFVVGFDWPGAHPAATGMVAEYAQLLLCDKPPSAMYPLLTYSMICMALLALSPERFVKRFAVRFGIYTGLLLAVQYWVIFLCACEVSPRHLEGVLAALIGTPAAILVPWFLGWVVVLLHRRYGPMVFAAIGMLLVWSMFALPRDMALVLLIAVSPIGWMFCATPWAMASYSVMSMYAVRHEKPRRFQFSLAQLLGVFTWLTVYIAAWRASIIWMLEEYAKLPEQAREELANLFFGCGCGL